jgi:GntR family transcriptional regulator/MocR family aminotransferase
VTRPTQAQVDEPSIWALERRPRESLRACLERTLREAIAEGSLRPGVELPASRRIAAQLGVSRGVARDAYAQLEAPRMLERGDYQRQIRKTRTAYRARRDRLTHELTGRVPELPVTGVSAGLHVLLGLPGEVDDRRVEQSARDAGIAVEALARYTLTDRGQRGLLLGYGRLHESAIPAAIAKLAPVLRAAIPP